MKYSLGISNFLDEIAAAAAKSLQSCPTLCDPIAGSPPASPIPGILQERTLEWVAISFSNAGKWKVKVKSFSRVWLLSTTWTAAFQAPLSMEFSRLEYWSEVLLPLHDEITSHLHYIVFLSFFALITEEGFLRTNNRKVLADPLPQYTSFKVRLVRWFLLRRNISPSKIHCYIN